MKGTDRRPCVLVVDDEELWQSTIREDLSVAPVSAEILSATTLRDAIDIAGSHGPDSDCPLDLVVLDMRLPVDAGHPTPVEDGGIRFLRQYGNVRCPVVVYTAYPDFDNCVLATQLGATAYVPEFPPNLDANSTQVDFSDNKLVQVCSALLERVASPVEGIPSDGWLQENYDWVNRHFAGFWVAFLGEEAAAHLCPKHSELRKRDHVVVMYARNADDLMQDIIRELHLFRIAPEIVQIHDSAEQ